MNFTRITARPDHPHARSAAHLLRIPVATVVGMVADGMGETEIVAAHPELEVEDVREAIRYAAEAVSERGCRLTGKKLFKASTAAVEVARMSLLDRLHRVGAQKNDVELSGLAGPRCRDRARPPRLRRLSARGCQGALPGRGKHDRRATGPAVW